MTTNDPHTRVTVANIPDCDICKSEGKQTKAYADAKLCIGPWANVCTVHFRAYDCHLGLGRGQELVLP